METFADTLVKDISPHDVRQYLSRLRQHYTSPDTISDHIRALHRFWKWTAGEYDLVNPMRTIAYPKPPKANLPKAVSLDDIIAMFRAADTGLMAERDQAILAFAFDTGARNEGIRSLKMADLDIVRHTAIITEKGRKTRSVVFTKVTAALLLRWLEARQYQEVATVFYSTDTLEPLTRSGLYQLFARLARRAGVTGKFNPHSFRHALTIQYIKAGGDPVTLARILGHESVDTLARWYAVFTNEEIAAAHERYSPLPRVLGDGQ